MLRFDFLIVLICFLQLKPITYRKQFSTTRKSNPRNVLLTSRNLRNYFYQCIKTIFKPLLLCPLLFEKTSSSKCGIENNKMLCRVDIVELQFYGASLKSPLHKPKQDMSGLYDMIIVMGNEWWLSIVVWLFTWYLCISRQLMLCWCMKIRLHMNTTSKAILLKLISLNISPNPGLRKIMVPLVRFDVNRILKMKIFDLIWLTLSSHSLSISKLQYV